MAFLDASAEREEEGADEGAVDDEKIEVEEGLAEEERVDAVRQIQDGRLGEQEQEDEERDDSSAGARTRNEVIRKAGIVHCAAAFYRIVSNDGKRSGRI
jgi:hypothetical protein